MPVIKITLNENDIRNAVKEYIERKYEMTLSVEVLLIIETKSKQNFKSEWENASYRATLESK